MRPNGSETLILFYSPQYLTVNVELLDNLLECNRLGTLCLVAIDEAHIYVMHGCFFRDSIRVLADVFFLPLYGAAGDHAPLLLVMTATLPYSLLWPLSALTHVDFTLAAHKFWLSAAEFQQQSIKIELHIRGRRTSDLRRA